MTFYRIKAFGFSWCFRSLMHTTKIRCSWKTKNSPNIFWAGSLFSFHALSSHCHILTPLQTRTSNYQRTNRQVEKKKRRMNRVRAHRPWRLITYSEYGPHYKYAIRKLLTSTIFYSNHPTPHGHCIHLSRIITMQTPKQFIKQNNNNTTPAIAHKLHRRM